MHNTLSDFCQTLEKENELIRIKTPVSTELEIAEIADRMSKSPNGGKALLFENTGSKFPVLINMLGSHARMQSSLYTNNYEKLNEEIHKIFKKITSPQHKLVEKLSALKELTKLAKILPGKQKNKAQCKEVIIKNPNLNILPILKTWPQDAAPFITLPQVITKDPKTGIRNVGMYRMQVIDNKTTAMHWHKHKVGARHYQEYKKLNKKMPVAVALGGDPVMTFAAVAPLPDNVDEYILAGFLRKQKIKMVKAETQDIEVPANADIVIEGYIDPKEQLYKEGPFGDHTGFYSLADLYPKFHITAITHKKNAIYPATVVGIPPMEDAYISKAIERVFLAPIQLSMLPEMQDMDIPVAGVSHNITIASIDKSFAGHAQKISNALRGAGQMMFNKILIVADQYDPIHDYKAFAKKACNRINPQHDITFSKGPLDILDHASNKFAYGSKMTIDATTKLPEELNGAMPKIDLSETANLIKKSAKEINTIAKINTKLLEENISMLWISVNKDDNFDFKKFASLLHDNNNFSKVKFIILLDIPGDFSDIEMLTWISTNNIEPLRDCIIFPAKDKQSVSQIYIDGTRKRNATDNFQRDWPNVVTMNSSTIKKVDQKWEEYGVGKFISSPSLKYLPLKINDLAVAEKNIS